MSDSKNMLIGVIADLETTACFLLAGIGAGIGKERNYLVADKSVKAETISEFFQRLYTRSDIGIILICQDIANRIKNTMKSCTKLMPVILRIPTKVYLERIQSRRLTFATYVPEEAAEKPEVEEKLPAAVDEEN